MKKSYLKYLLNASIIIGLILAGVKYLNGKEVFIALQEFDYSYAPLLLLFSAGYLLLRAWRFVLLLLPLEDNLFWWPVFKSFIAGQAAVLIPGGIAVRTGLLKQANIPISDGSIPVFFSSGIDQIVLITSALIVALWFERGRLPVMIIVGCIIIGVVLTIIPQTRHLMFHVADWVAGKLKIQDDWHGFIKNLPEIITWSTMASTVALTIVAFILHIVMLGLSTQGMGVSVSYAVLTLAYILPTVLGRLSGLPGGIGVTEAGMVGLLISTTSELDKATAFAAVAIFRITSIFFITLLGAIVYFLAWHGKQESAMAESS